MDLLNTYPIYQQPYLVGFLGFNSTFNTD